MGVSYVSLNELQSTGHVANLMFLKSLNPSCQLEAVQPGRCCAGSTQRYYGYMYVHTDQHGLTKL